MATNPVKPNPASSGTVSQREFTDDFLRGIGSLEDAMTLMADMGGVVESTQEIGSGFALTDNKQQFVGVPLMLIKWDTHPGAYGTPFISCYLITEHSDRWIIIDGGEGICHQLREYTAKTGRQHGMLCPRGFTSSDYKFCQDCQTSNSKHDTECHNCGSPKLGAAQTFYIA